MLVNEDSDRRLHLTSGAEEEEDQDPVDPEDRESEKGTERLQCQQRKVDKHFPRNVKQGDGQGHPLPHEQHQKQQNPLREQKAQRSEVYKNERPL